jgi:hypothetical protein
VIYAAAQALDRLDDDHATVYYDLILSGLDEVARRALEAMMRSGEHEWQSDFAKKYVGLGIAEGKVEGKAEGKAEALLTILSIREVPITDEERQRIIACREIAHLDRWVARAVTATSIADVFGEDAA